jgi:hypothetical protein
VKVLVAATDLGERQRIAKALAKECTVTSAASASAAAQAATAERPEIAIVESAWVSTFRKMIGDQMYVAALLSAKPSPTDFWAAYAAGADDVLRSFACAEEIAGRLTTVRRLRKLVPATVSSKLAKVRVWDALESIVTSELGSLLGASLEPAAATSDPVVEAGGIDLTLSAESVVVHLALGIDATTGSQLQQTLLGGDARAEALQDALREMANTAAGAVKRAALDDGVAFTIGLPTNDHTIPAAKSRRQRRWACRGDGLVITCVATADSNQPAQVMATELKEGMVLARDVVNATGMLLVAAGTYITRTTAEQLARLVGNTQVEVTSPS